MVLEVKRTPTDTDDVGAGASASTGAGAGAGASASNGGEGSVVGDKPTCTDRLYRTCRVCGYQEEEEKGGVILEIDLQEKTSEGYKVILNEFTQFDPTLPHVSNIICRNGSCRSRTSGVKPDVIYIKYDAVNMKYLYICTVCDAPWRST